MTSPIQRFCLPLVAGLLLGGCSVLDPYNIVGRARPTITPASVPVYIPDDSWKKQAVEVVWKTIDERYYDPKFNGIDWAAVRARYEPQILAAKTDDEYWELLDKMTGELKDSHTRVHAPKDVQLQRKGETHSLGLGFFELNGELVLTSVHPESDAWWAGARPGMTIKSIEGEPAMAVYKRLLTQVRGSSTDWARSRGAIRKINSGDVGTSASMVFARNDGSEIAANMKRRAFEVYPDFVHRVLPSGFAYIRFSNFLPGLKRAVLSAVDEMKDTPGMILDLRNNGGGNGAFAQELIARFLSEKTKVGRVITRTGKPITFLLMDQIKLEPELEGNKEKAYTKPLVVLVNENSASASEITAGSLQDLGRATLFGRRTCGCLLGYLGYADLPGGGQMAYSEIGFVSYKGKRVEGEGITPDQPVTITKDDYVLNRDRTLEAAEAFLKKQTAQTTQLSKSEK